MEHFDIIIVGTRAAGGTLAYKLATTGKRILVLERGTFLPREKENWDTKVVFGSDRYHNKEIWYDRDGKELHLGMSYFVGGNTNYFTGKLPLDGVGHQVGTCRFGEDPKTSVLNLNCQTHDIDNLYVVDGSFFCSSGAVNPTLTIIANALRVAEHLIERMEVETGGMV
jgi:choline dehydrogenase-like flavoprotein